MPKEQQFTPGPWETSRDAVPPGHVQITVYAETGGRGTRVATVFETEANAQLIAAAPELFKALTGAQSALRKALPFVPPDNEGIYCGEWLDEINAALALVEVAQ